MDYKAEIKLLKRYRSESKYQETIDYIDKQIDKLKEKKKNGKVS